MTRAADGINADRGIAAVTDRATKRGLIAQQPASRQTRFEPLADDALGDGFKGRMAEIRQILQPMSGRGKR